MTKPAMPTIESILALKEVHKRIYDDAEQAAPKDYMTVYREKYKEFEQYVKDSGWVILAEGGTRIALMHKDFMGVVVKFPHTPTSKTNLKEYEKWQNALDAERVFLAETYYVSEDGYILIMEAIHGTNFTPQDCKDAKEAVAFWTDTCDFNGRVRYMSPVGVRIPKIIDYPY